MKKKPIGYVCECSFELGEQSDYIPIEYEEEFQELLEKRILGEGDTKVIYKEHYSEVYHSEIVEETSHFYLVMER